ncbi:hypothetical protein SRHO_G00032680 [Serrasalmus rhombeus]
MIQEKMAKTSAHRRHGIISQTPSREDIKARWPALFKASHLQDEFQRITTVHLESKFMSKLDEYTPKLLVLFHSRAGAVGLRLQAILLKDADGDGASQDLAVQKMKIYKIQTEASEGTADFGIVVEGGKVLTDLGNFARACSMLVGFAYAVDLAYPKELSFHTVKELVSHLNDHIGEGRKHKACSPDSIDDMYMETRPQPSSALASTDDSENTHEAMQAASGAIDMLENDSGFTENFSRSQHFCRYCEVTRREFETDPNACGPPLTPETYDAAVAELQSKNIPDVRGIKVTFLLQHKYE